MRAIENPLLWQEAWLDTPLRTPGPEVSSPEEAMIIPGCYVISIERASDQSPKLFGRLVLFDEDKDRVVVRSSDVHHLNGNPKTIWMGTVAQYKSMWRCD